MVSPGACAPACPPSGGVAATFPARRRNRRPRRPRMRAAKVSLNSGARFRRPLPCGCAGRDGWLRRLPVAAKASMAGSSSRGMRIGGRVPGQGAQGPGPALHLPHRDQSPQGRAAQQGRP